MRVRTGVAAQTVTPPKPARPKPAKAAKRPKPIVWPWYAFSEGVLGTLKSRGYVIAPTANGQVFTPLGNGKLRLIILRHTARGLEAQAAGNLPVGRSAAFRAAARRARHEVDRALKRLAASGIESDLLGTLGSVRSKLKAADKPKRVDPRPPGSGLHLDVTERSSSVRTVSGGLPSLGKRR